MTADKIISVNPAKATLGSLHPEITARYLREYTREVNHQTALQKFFRFAVGQTADRSGSKKMLMLRVLFSVMMLMTAILSPSTAFDIPAALLMVCATFILTGCLTLPAAGLIGIMSVFGIISGFTNNVFPMQAVMLMGMSMVMLMFGPGRISADFIVYRMIRRNNMQRKRRLRTAPLTYKAFRNMQRMQ